MSDGVKLSVADLRKRIDAGDRLAEIGRDTGYAASTISRHCRAAGIAVPRARGPRRKLPPTQKLIGLLEAGLTATQISTLYGVVPSAIHSALARDGYELRDAVVYRLDTEGTAS